MVKVKDQAVLNLEDFKCAYLYLAAKCVLSEKCKYCPRGKTATIIMSSQNNPNAQISFSSSSVYAQICLQQKIATRFSWKRRHTLSALQPINWKITRSRYANGVVLIAFQQTLLRFTRTAYSLYDVSFYDFFPCSPRSDGHANITVLK